MPTRKRSRGLAASFVLVALLMGGGAAAQGTAADYERANAMPARVGGEVVGGIVAPNWIDGGRALWYRAELPGGGARFRLVDCEAGIRRPLFDHAALARALGRVLGKEVDADRLPLAGLAPGRDFVDLWVAEGARGFRWSGSPPALVERDLVEIESFRLEPRPAAPRSRDGGGRSTILFVNPGDEAVELFWIERDGARRSYGVVAAGDRRVMSTFTGHAWAMVAPSGRDLCGFVAGEAAGVAVIRAAARPAPTRRRDEVSPDGRTEALFRDHDLVLRDVESGAETVVTEGGEARDGFGGAVHWSPDSSRLLVVRTERPERRRLQIVESSPRDRLQPRLRERVYVKPGDPIDRPRPWLVERETASARALDPRLFPEPWSLSRYRWDSDGRRLTFLYNERGHGLMRVLAVDAATAQVTVLLEEDPSTFFDYTNKLCLEWLSDDEFLWMSERGGRNQVFLVSGRDGAILNAVTSADWVVRGVDRVDASGRRLHFRALGVHDGEDPYHVHHGSVGLDGRDLVWKTRGDGTHEIRSSPDGRFLVDTWSRVDLPPRSVLRRAADGEKIVDLEEADVAALLATGWRPPERFVAKGRDGETEIWGVVWRPTARESGARRPVIEHIYAGPHGAHVPKSFSAWHEPRRLAELGFVVVQIDGMGTNWRSKSFHDVCWKNLGDSGFPDRIAWIRALAARDPSLDLERVGIYGGSAGGQSALRALLVHGDFYRAAVADCGCHDNRMDKIWWNEMWMGWPLGDHYAEQSNVTQAHRLEGRLLLVVGELDENVDPSSTMQVVDALVRADKDFDLLVLPGVGHGAAETPYGKRRRMDHFVRHLLGVEPRR